MNRLVFLALALFGVFATASSVQAQLVAAAPLDRIVAIAEDDVILQSELDATVQQILTQYRSNPQQLPPRDVLERQVLDRLIMVRLQVQRAQSTGIRVTDNDVDQTIQRIAQQNHVDVSQLRASLQHDGVDYDGFRKTLKEQLLVDRLRQRVVAGAPQVTDAEIDSLIASGSVKTGEIHLAHILIGLPDNANAAQIEEARVKADNVKKQIDGGMDFAAAAIRFSNAQDALDGGDLGWRRMDSVPQAFAELAETMQPGQVSQVMRAPNGFHIVKVVEKRNSGGKQVVTEYHGRHIEIAITELVSSEDAQRKINDIRHRIVDGHEDFVALARQYSNDAPTANLGGEMGWFVIDQYGPKVAEVLSKMKEGEVSPAFQTDVGWHILQLLGKRDADRTDQLKREQAREILRTRKSDDEYEQFLRSVRSDSYIEIRLPGAENKPATAH